MIGKVLSLHSVSCGHSARVGVAMQETDGLEVRQCRGTLQTLHWPAHARGPPGDTLSARTVNMLNMSTMSRCSFIQSIGSARCQAVSSSSGHVVARGPEECLLYQLYITCYGDMFVARVSQNRLALGSHCDSGPVNCYLEVYQRQMRICSQQHCSTPVIAPIEGSVQRRPGHMRTCCVISYEMEGQQGTPSLTYQPDSPSCKFIDAPFSNSCLIHSG